MQIIHISCHAAPILTA